MVQQQSIQPSLDELAALSGYQAEAETASQPTPLLDAADLEEEKSETQPLWSNPWLKLGVVGSVLGVVMLGLAMFIGNAETFSPTPTSEEEAISTPEVETFNPFDTPQNPQEEEFSKLKTELALGSQAQALAKKQEGTPTTAVPKVSVPQEAEGKGISATPKPTPSTSGTTPITSTPATSTAVTRPTPAPVVKPASSRPTPPAPVVRPQPPRPAPPAPVQPTPAPSVSSPRPVEEVDPTQQLQATLAMGSYGSGSLQLEPTQPVKEVSTEGDSLYHAHEAAIFSGTPVVEVTVPAGNRAVGVLSTPVFWATDLEASQQPQQFVIELADPLFAQDGTVAIPGNTQILTTVHSISESGLVSLGVTQMSLPTATGGKKVVAVPAGAITISAEAGTPLMATYLRDDEGLQKRNTNLAVMAGLAKVGEILNRTGTTTSFQTAGGNQQTTVSTTNNASPNILGAVIEGSFGELHRQVTTREETAVQEILARPNLWYIEAGIPVEIFVNTSWTLMQ